MGCFSQAACDAHIDPSVDSCFINGAMGACPDCDPKYYGLGGKKDRKKGMDIRIPIIVGVVGAVLLAGLIGLIAIVVMLRRRSSTRKAQASAAPAVAMPVGTDGVRLDFPQKSEVSPSHDGYAPPK